jgi:hypothetical protein
VEALKPHGKLVVFFPSVTQVMEFVVWATETKQPLHAEKTIELMPGSWAPGFTDAVGGREWDVRTVTPRKAKREAATAQTASDGDAGASDVVAAEPNTVQVCRPKVGNLVGGGGFLAVFTKKLPNTSQSQEGEKVTSEESAESTPSEG